MVYYRLQSHQGTVSARILDSQTPGEHRELRLELDALIQKAEEICKRLAERFTFEKFEREMYRERGSLNDIITHFDDYIQSLRDEGRVSTADSYRLAIKSLIDFAGEGKRTKPTMLPFQTFSSIFLKRYEMWMLSLGRSNATTGIYLRNLRAVFNLAINQGDSYQCNGMNFRDIAELRYKQVTAKSFSFIRRKTINTAKDDPRLIIIPMTEKISAVIEKYGNPKKNKDQYVFPISTSGMTEDQKLRINRNFIRFVNQHMNKLAKLAGLDINLTTYVARHTFTTSAIRSGASMEFVQETLGHHSMSTTQNYWAGFEDEVKAKFAETLMNF